MVEGAREGMTPYDPKAAARALIKAWAVEPSDEHVDANWPELRVAITTALAAAYAAGLRDGADHRPCPHDGCPYSQN
jgi:hypothetical protein